MLLTRGVFTAGTMTSTPGITPCSLVEVYGHYRLLCFHRLLFNMEYGRNIFLRNSRLHDVV
jgi:hypothetical protein